jgi:predicted RNA polymerase sigma factor
MSVRDRPVKLAVAPTIKMTVPACRCGLGRRPRAAMTELDTLAGALDRYHLYHATRAELLRALGCPDRARAADRLALELSANPAG